MQVDTSERVQLQQLMTCWKPRCVYQQVHKAPRSPRNWRNQHPIQGFCPWTLPGAQRTCKEPYKCPDLEESYKPPTLFCLSPLWNKSLHLWREGQTRAPVKTHCSSRKGARKKCPIPAGRTGGKNMWGPELQLKDDTGAALSLSPSYSTY